MRTFGVQASDLTFIWFLSLGSSVLSFGFRTFSFELYL